MGFLCLFRTKILLIYLNVRDIDSILTLGDNGRFESVPQTYSDLDF